MTKITVSVSVEQDYVAVINTNQGEVVDNTTLDALQASAKRIIANVSFNTHGQIANLVSRNLLKVTESVEVKPQEVKLSDPLVPPSLEMTEPPALQF